MFASIAPFHGSPKVWVGFSLPHRVYLEAGHALLSVEPAEARALAADLIRAAEEAEALQAAA